MSNQLKTSTGSPRPTEQSSPNNFSNARNCQTSRSSSLSPRTNSPRANINETNLLDRESTSSIPLCVLDKDESTKNVEFSRKSPRKNNESPRCHDNTVETNSLSSETIIINESANEDKVKFMEKFIDNDQKPIEIKSFQDLLSLQSLVEEQFITFDNIISRTIITSNADDTTKDGLKEFLTTNSCLEAYKKDIAQNSTSNSDDSEDPIFISVPHHTKVEIIINGQSKTSTSSTDNASTLNFHISYANMSFIFTIILGFIIMRSSLI